jgi:hypothetical protein
MYPVRAVFSACVMWRAQEPSGAPLANNLPPWYVAINICSAGHGRASSRCDDPSSRQQDEAAFGFRSLTTPSWMPCCSVA